LIELIETCFLTNVNVVVCRYIRGNQCGAHEHWVARKDQVRGPRACSKDNISIIRVFTLINVNTEIIEGKLIKIFILKVCIKLVALGINPCTRSSSQFQKGWWPLHYIMTLGDNNEHFTANGGSLRFF